MTGLSHPFGCICVCCVSTSYQPPMITGSDDLVEAWLFHCWAPGRHCVFASVDKEDKSWWPTDQWEGVTRMPLIIRGEPDVIHGVKPPRYPFQPGESR